MGGRIKIKYLWVIVIMNDTPQHIKDLQLKLWLEKTPEERLMQFLADNDAMFKAILHAKKELGIQYNPLEGHRK
jgi:hypothetical protein